MHPHKPTDGSNECLVIWAVFLVQEWSESAQQKLRNEDGEMPTLHPTKSILVLKRQPFGMRWHAHTNRQITRINSWGYGWYVWSKNEWIRPVEAEIWGWGDDHSAPNKSILVLKRQPFGMGGRARTNRTMTRINSWGYWWYFWWKNGVNRTSRSRDMV